MMSIADQIRCKGRIKSGENAGFFVRIPDDSTNTGGYLVLLWKEDSPVGYDSSVETLADLEQFFRESAWEIDWLE
jgi:hypothetical protein